MATLAQETAGAAESTNAAEELEKKPKKAKKRGGKKKWIIVVVVVVIIALLAAYFLRSRGAENTTTSTYTIVQPETRTITKTLTGSGTLTAADSYTISSLVEGDIITADFEEGDLVEKDDVLYEIDSSDVSKNIENAELNVSSSSRNYSNVVDTQYVKADTAGTVYELNVEVGDEVSAGQTIGTVRDSATMTLKLPFPADDAVGFYTGQSATITLDGTFETLYGTVSEVSGTTNVGSGNMLTRTVTIKVTNPGGLTNSQSATATINGVGCSSSGTFSYNSESSLVTSASGTVTAILVPEGSSVSKNQTVVTLGGDDLSDSIQSASESLRSANISLENAQDNLDDYTITAPISGTIVAKEYKVGETYEANETLCIIYDLTYLEMSISIDELDINDVQVGQAVTITADAVSGETFTGTVTKVSVVGTTSGGTTSYPVTVEIDEMGDLLPGMNVDATIIIEESEDALSIPTSAVVRNNLVMITADSPSAVNAVETQAAEGYVYVEVETGISDDNYVEILSGLTEEDTVAYTPSTVTNNTLANIQNMMGGGMGMSGGMGGGPGGM